MSRGANRSGLAKRVRRQGEQATSLLHRALPDLEMFNVTIQAVHQLPISASEIWIPVAYALLYATLLLALGSIIFERRDFR